MRSLLQQDARACYLRLIRIRRLLVDVGGDPDEGRHGGRDGRRREEPAIGDFTAAHGVVAAPPGQV